MKKKLSLLIALSALTLSVGAAVGVGAGVKGAEEAKADDEPAATVEYRFTNNYSWTNIEVHAWNSEGNCGYLSPTLAYKNEKNQDVYTINLAAGYTGILFQGKSGSTYTKTRDFDISGITGDCGFYISGDGNWIEDRTLGTYSLTSVYYLYDYYGKLNGAANCYAWNEYTDVGTNAPWPGQSMVRIDAAQNNVLFSIELDVKYNSVIFSNGSQTIDLKPTTSLAPSDTKAFYIDGSADSSGHWKGAWWDDVNYAVAQNWHDHLLNFNNISAEAGAGADGTGCEGYYEDAKKSYKNMNTYMKAKINENFHEALERMVKWAEHHHESFTVENGSGVFSSVNVISPVSVEANYTAVIILASALALIAVGGYFLLRKARKED